MLWLFFMFSYREYHALDKALISIRDIQVIYNVGLHFVGRQRKNPVNSTLTRFHIITGAERIELYFESYKSSIYKDFCHT